MRELQQIKADEGFRAYPYRCTADKLTIGYGLNLENGISEDEAETILIMRLRKIYAALTVTLPWYATAPDEVKDVLVNMVYNMGLTGVLKFKYMLAAMERKDWTNAAFEMRHSRWYRQVTNRAERLAQRIEALADG